MPGRILKKKIAETFDIPLNGEREFTLAYANAHNFATLEAFWESYLKQYRAREKIIKPIRKLFGYKLTKKEKLEKVVRFIQQRWRWARKA